MVTGFPYTAVYAHARAYAPIWKKRHHVSLEDGGGQSIAFWLCFGDAVGGYGGCETSPDAAYTLIGAEGGTYQGGFRCWNSETVAAIILPPCLRLHGRRNRN
jgi:hypothetical protein